jgi:hypothetical protein
MKFFIVMPVEIVRMAYILMRILIREIMEDETESVIVSSLQKGAQSRVFEQYR